jgi:hypothetical protein
MSAVHSDEKYADFCPPPPYEDAPADALSQEQLLQERQRLVSAVSELERLRAEMETKVRAEILKEMEAKEAEEKRRHEEEIERLRVLREKNMTKIPKIIEYLYTASRAEKRYPAQLTSTNDKITTALTKWMDTLESEYIGSYTIWAQACDNGTLQVNSNTYLITTVGIYRMYFSVTNTVIMYDVTIQHIYQFDTSLSGTIMEKMLLAYPPTYIWWSNTIGNMPDTTWNDAVPRFLSLVHAIPGTQIA